MAIDLSLRIKNDKLYDEKYQIPDYDIIDLIMYYMQIILVPYYVIIILQI